jgi:hypothetical protein
VSDFCEIPFCSSKNCGIKDKHRHFEDGMIQFVWVSPDIRPESGKIKITSFNVQISDDEQKP